MEASYLCKLSFKTIKSNEILQLRSKDSQVKTQLCVAYTPPYTHRERFINGDKIVPNNDNLQYLQFYIFTILYWL
jgi:hypothetical protein